LRAIALSVVIFVLASCSGPAPAPAPDPATRLQAIPAANAEHYHKIQDMTKWRNPYLVLQADNIGLLDVSNNVEHRIKAEELPEALAQLPVSAWPYGRVVAVAEVASASAEDKSRIRDNRAKVAETCHSLQVQVYWVPAA